MFLLLMLFASPCPAVFDQLGDCTITCTDTEAHVVSPSGRELDIGLSHSESHVAALTQSGICHRTTRASRLVFGQKPSLAEEEPPQAVGFIANTGRLNQIAVSASGEPLQMIAQLRVDYLRTITPSVDIGPSLSYSFMAGEHRDGSLFWFSVVTAGLQLRARIAKVGPATFGMRSLVDFGYGASDQTTIRDADYNVVGWGEGGAFVGRARVEAVADVHLGRFALLFAVFGGVVWEVSRVPKGVLEWETLAFNANVPASEFNEPRGGVAPAFGARVGVAIAINKGTTWNVTAEVANFDLVVSNRLYPVTFNVSTGPSFVF